MLRTFLAFFIFFFIIYGIEAFGVSPETENVRTNDTFRISCSIRRTGQGRLLFYDNEDGLISEEFIERINDTCIVMSQHFTRRIRKNYTCKLGPDTVGDSSILVDDEIKKVESFKCQTNDLIEATCSFKKPPFFHPIKYTLDYQLDNETRKFEAHVTQDGNGGYLSTFSLPQSNQKVADQKLIFEVKALSEHFTREDNFEMKLLEILQPKNPVQNLSIMDNLSTHSRAIFTFSLPKELEKASQQMLYDVQQKIFDDKHDDWSKVTSLSLEIRNNEGYLVLDDLDYANTIYNVRIRVKSKFANDDEESWSPYSEISFKTSPKAPEAVPITCPNCFNVMDNGNVFVYWMEVQKRHQNAGNFLYLVRAWNETYDEVITARQNETAMIVPETFPAKSLLIKLFSSNSVGNSTHFSQIYVPLHKNSIKMPILKLRKELVNENYRISWKMLTSLEVESFSVIWCKQQSLLLNQCDGAINIETVPSTTNEFVVDASVTKQFGVAANFKNIEQLHGFVWAECTAAKESEIGKVHSMWSTLDSDRSITLHWKLNCVDESITIGYNISYCQIDESDFSKCIEPENFVIAVDDEISQHEIKNLKSYTLYNVSVALMSTYRMGFAKQPIMVRTMEAAPTAPRNLKAVKISQNSIEFTWNRPTEVNAVSMTYQLWFNEKKVNIYADDTMNETFSFVLKRLEPFTDYTITVVACTNDCSNSSDSLKIRTAISEPGVMFQPTYEVIAKKRILVSWQNPDRMGGNLDYFQVKLASLDVGVQDKIFRIIGRMQSCFIEGWTCEKPIKLFVRGINVDGNILNTVDDSQHNETVNCLAFLEPDVAALPNHFYGLWSQPLIYSCLSKSSTVMVTIVVVSLVIMCLAAFTALKIYNKVMMMKDIHIVWPSGLDPDVSPSKHSSPDVIKNLISDHVLGNIEEGEEVEENEKLMLGASALVGNQLNNEMQRDSTKDELFLPFICNPKTNEITYQVPKIVSIKEKTQSSPSNDYTKLPKMEQQQVENLSGYTKMSPPQNLTIDNPAVIEGYLDMSGSKSPSPVKCNLLTSGYTINDIKIFLKDSEMNNNGYIGKRTSIISDPQRKHPPVMIGSNGYVVQQK